jgi:hypothetical protein
MMSIRIVTYLRDAELKPPLREICWRTSLRYVDNEDMEVPYLLPAIEGGIVDTREKIVGPPLMRAYQTRKPLWILLQGSWNWRLIW